VTDLSPLRDADPVAARALLEHAPAEDLVAAIRAIGDEALEALVGRDEIRSVVVEVILGRLHEYAVPDRVARLDGIVRLDLARHGTLLERHALEFRDGGLRAVLDVAEDAPADVVLTTSPLGFVRLVSGERNAGLEFLAGHLDIDGDATLAIGVGGIFRVPGTGQAAMEPTRIDPVDVATVLADVPDLHLRKVMASDFRPVVLDEIFRRLPEFLNPHKAAGVELSVGFRLLGNPSGVVERYVVHVRDGAATVETGDVDGERDATVTCQGHDYLKLATGHLSPVLGVLTGTLKVKGDKGKALRLSQVIDVPRPR